MRKGACRYLKVCTTRKTQRSRTISTRTVMMARQEREAEPRSAVETSASGGSCSSGTSGSRSVIGAGRRGAASGQPPDVYDAGRRCQVGGDGQNPQRPERLVDEQG